jgi:hypothetical protein
LLPHQLVTEPLEQEFHKEFSPRKYSVRGTSYNAVSTEDSPIGADIDRNDSAKLNSRNVIAKFASPDRLLNKMKEKKVGVAAKMYSEKAKTNNFDEATGKKSVQEGKTLNIFEEKILCEILVLVVLLQFSFPSFLLKLSSMLELSFLVDYLSLHLNLIIARDFVFHLLFVLDCPFHNQNKHLVENYQKYLAFL